MVFCRLLYSIRLVFGYFHMSTILTHLQSGLPNIHKQLVIYLILKIKKVRIKLYKGYTFSYKSLSHFISCSLAELRGRPRDPSIYNTGS